MLSPIPEFGKIKQMRKLLLLTVLAALVFLVYQNAKLSTELAKKNEALNRQSEEIHDLNDQLMRLQKKDQGAVQQEKDAIAQLQQMLQRKQDELSRAEQRWRIVRNGGEPFDETPELQDKIRREKALLQSLDAQIRQYQAQESQIGSSSKAYQDQERWTERGYKDQLNQRLADQNQNLKALQGQLDDWKKRRLQPDATEHIQALQSQIQDQKNEINRTKQQQKDINQEFGADIANVRAQSEQSKLTVGQAIQQLQQQRRAEKTSLDQLEARFQQAQQARASRKDAIRQLEQDYHDRKAEAENLQAQLRDRQARLQGLEH